MTVRDLMIRCLLIPIETFMFILALSQNSIRKCCLFTKPIQLLTFSLLNLLFYKVKFMIIRNPQSLSIFIRILIKMVYFCCLEFLHL